MYNKTLSLQKKVKNELGYKSHKIVKFESAKKKNELKSFEHFKTNKTSIQAMDCYAKALGRKTLH